MVPDLTDVPVMDESAALDMVEGERDLLEEILELFRENTTERLAELEAGLSEGCLETIASAAHSIKGSSANICVERVRMVATQLEADARQAKTDNLQELGQLLSEEYERFNTEASFTA